MKLDAPATGCTFSERLAFTTTPRSHEVVALRIEDGRTAWRFISGGPVDTPPTFDQGRLYFGCDDGWVYCLRAADGALAWRCRVAPADRLVGAFGHLASAWPAHGSVLVHEGCVYAAAGRSSFLDGGIFAAVLDARTGRTLKRKCIASEQNMEVGTGHSWSEQSGLLDDLLVREGASVYMRQQRLFEVEGESPGGAQSSAAGQGPLHALGGLLDDTWFSRTWWFLGKQPYGDYLVFDATRVYGVRARPQRSTDGGFFVPGREGYELFAAARGKPAGKSAAANVWSRHVRLRVWAMTPAGPTLFVAGTPDEIDKKDPWAAYEGRRGGAVLAVDAATGKTLRRIELDAAPAYDGMSVAHGRLILATRDGQVICFAPAAE